VPPIAHARTARANLRIGNPPNDEVPTVDPP
jgi:hypothetical protein